MLMIAGHVMSLASRYERRFCVRVQSAMPEKRRTVSGFLSVHGDEIKREKGIWWMPWRVEAMKDVARCDKPWGAASRL